MEKGLIFPSKSLEFIYVLKGSQFVPKLIILFKGLLSLLPEFAQSFIPFFHFFIHLAKQFSIVLCLSF